jgi:peptide/nickel transport system permease protein
MARLVVSRLFQAVIVLLLLTLVVFALLRLVPGDPILQILGPYADRETMERLREQLGFNQPVYEQYVSWLGNLLRGDLGDSIISRQSVMDILTGRIPVTLQVALGAWAVTIAIGLPAGIFAALNRNRWPDYLFSIFAVGGVAMPSFWLAIMMIIVFAVHLGWVPTSGFVSPTTDFWKSMQLSLMPWLVAGIGGAAVLMRQTRSALLEVLGQDYIRTATAKGLTHRVVVLRHALRNAMIPVVTIIGLALGNLLAGAVIVEVVFGLPGMGRLLVESLWTHDYPVVQGIVLIVGISVVLSNLLVDIAYGWLDPRVRYG